MIFNFANFHQRTRAIFLDHPAPNREPDYISPSCSVYWDTRHGVVRASNHWVGTNGCLNQASCVWTLLGDTGFPDWRIGYCAYEDFAPFSKSEKSIDPTRAENNAIAQWLLARGGARDPNDWPADFGPIPRWVRIAPRGSLAATNAATALFAASPNLTHALCARAAAFHAALNGQDVPWP